MVAVKDACTRFRDMKQHVIDSLRLRRRTVHSRVSKSPPEHCIDFGLVHSMGD